VLVNHRRFGWSPQILLHDNAWVNRAAIKAVLLTAI